MLYDSNDVVKSYMIVISVKKRMLKTLTVFFIDKAVVMSFGNVRDCVNILNVFKI